MSALFDRILIIGAGLIGSSIARAVKAGELAGHLAICDANADHLAEAEKLALADSYPGDAASRQKALISSYLLCLLAQ